MEIVRDPKVPNTDSDKVGRSRYVAAAAILAIINVVVLITASQLYCSKGGYLFSSGS